MLKEGKVEDCGFEAPGRPESDSAGGNESKVEKACYGGGEGPLWRRNGGQHYYGAELGYPVGALADQAPDMVNSPPHYLQFGMEVIDIIRYVLGEDGFRAYCIGNELKYRLRAGDKGDAAQDIAKARKYREFREKKAPAAPQEGPARIFQYLADGNGYPLIFQDLAMRLEHARREHPRFAHDDFEALKVIHDEFKELQQAVHLCEGRRQIVYEALDVATTALRLAMGEVENG